MKTLIISTSLNPKSRSEAVAQMCEEHLRHGSETRFVRMKDFPLQGHDLQEPLQSEDYKQLHGFVSEADGLVLASPIYNWGCGSELKRFIEVVGSTPSDGSLRGAFFDKVVTFVNSAGLPRSYMAFLETATSMMLDFKCIISPYNVYVSEQDWEKGRLNQMATNRLSKSMEVFLQFTSLLKARTYRSGWEI